MGLIPTLAVWYVKAIYLAAVDAFRADDAHPLLAPFATTVVAWSLAGCTLIAGGAAGVSYRLGLLIVLAGPLSVSIVNAVACDRLWHKYHDLLFRDGPLVPGQETPRTAASSSAHRPLGQLAAIAGTVIAIGPVALGLIVVGNHFLKVPRISGPVALRWSHLTGNYVSSPRWRAARSTTAARTAGCMPWMLPLAASAGPIPPEAASTRVRRWRAASSTSAATTASCTP